MVVALRISAASHHEEGKKCPHFSFATDHRSSSFLCGLRQLLVDADAGLTAGGSAAESASSKPARSPVAAFTNRESQSFNVVRRSSRKQVISRSCASRLRSFASASARTSRQ